MRTFWVLVLGWMVMGWLVLVKGAMAGEVVPGVVMSGLAGVETPAAGLWQDSAPAVRQID